MNTNLDMSGKLIRPRQVVSWHGYRGKVVSVQAGRCIVAFKGSVASDTRNLTCDSVQVVQPKQP